MHNRKNELYDPIQKSFKLNLLVLINLCFSVQGFMDHFLSFDIFFIIVCISSIYGLLVSPLVSA